MSPACSQALGLPEIVAAILEYLEDAKDLFAALQVNTLWADEATTVLWREEPPLRAVKRINDVERLQYYVDKITTLNFDYRNNAWKFFIPEQAREMRQKVRSLRFPRLTRLHATIMGGDDEQNLLHYLQPKLQSLVCAGSWPISDKLLMQVEMLCPTLRNFSISSWLGTIEPQTCDLLRFLKGMPSITSIHLGDGLENIIPDDLHVHLASRPNLRVLQIWSLNLTRKGSQKISAAVADPYPRLTQLSCYSSYRVFDRLSRHLHGLKLLRLELGDENSGDIFFALSRYTNLIEMELIFANNDEYQVPAEGLLSIARNCPRLRVFTLRTRSFTHPSYVTISGRGITDDIIKQVATYLPAMTTFNLAIPTCITTMALLHLGDLCTNLTECCLIGDFDIRELCCSKIAPLLPQLRKLQLSKVSNKISLEQADSILYQIFPNLDSLKLYFKTGIGDWEDLSYQVCN